MTKSVLNQMNKNRVTNDLPSPTSAKRWHHPQKQRSSGSKKSRRLVHFLPVVRIVNVDHVNEMSEDFCRSMWYGKTEIDAIKLNLRITLQNMESGKSLDPQEFCTRGLESRTKQERKKRNLIRKEAMLAVLAGQSQQRGSDSCDDEHIARVYQNESLHCQRKAYKMALQDAEFARQVSVETV